MSTKRFVALVMALAMLFTLTAPAFTFAEGETSYQITIESTSNGSVTTQPAKETAEGEEVTLTVSPADGYHLEALTVKDASDQKVTVTNNKFTMPASNVTIRATFGADPVPEEPAAEEPANEEPTDGGDESGDGESVCSHNMTYIPAAAPTCGRAGNIEYWYCSVCEKYFSDADGENEIAESSLIVPATKNHNLTHHEAVAATCTAQGNPEYSECDTYFSNEQCTAEIGEKDLVIPALGHSFGEWTVTTEPTCTEAGEETRTCSRCDATETQSVPNLGGHDYTVVNSSTCTEAGVNTYSCSRCNDTYTEDAPALGHDYTAVVTEPTCTEQGYTTHTCSRCGDSYADTYTDTLDHDYGEWTVTTEPTCTEAGEETQTCSRCNAVETRPVDALGHDYDDWTVTTEPTCTEAGEETRTCSRCGATETRPVDALGHDYENGVCTVCEAVDPECATGDTKESGDEESLDDVRGIEGPEEPARSNLDDGFYLIGTMNEDSEGIWKIENLNSSYKLTRLSGNEYMIKTSVSSTDRFKIVKVEDNTINDYWYGSGDGNSDYQINPPYTPVGSVTIYFRDTWQNGENGTNNWNGHIYVAQNYTVTIGSFENGSITASAALGDLNSVSPDETVTLTAAPATGYVLSALSYNNTMLTVEGGQNEYTFSMPAEDVTVTATFALAKVKVGEICYLTLGDAIAYANGGTVTLLDDLEEMVNVDGLTVTLDLNGKTIAGVIINSGSLNITGSGTISSGAESTIINNGTLTVNEGTIENTNNTSYCAITNIASGSLTIQGGTVRGATAVDNAGSLAITDGFIDGRICGSGAYNITGGSFTFDPTSLLSEPYYATCIGNSEYWRVDRTEETLSGTCGDNLTWEFNAETGTLTITGSGAMRNYDDDEGVHAPWHELRGQITSISLPADLTTIGNWAFSHCTSLTEITIPVSVTSIGEGSFAGCSAGFTVNYGGTVAQKTAISIDNQNDPLLNALWHCTDEDVVLFTIRANNGNSSDHQEENEIYPVGTSLEIWPNPFSYEDHIFTGWNTQADGNGNAYATGDTIVLNEDLTLYAQWESPWTQVNEADFDPDFWAWLLAQTDDGEPQYAKVENGEAYINLDADRMEIDAYLTSILGVNQFVNLEVLTYEGHDAYRLNAVDLSGMTKLRELNLNWNELTAAVLDASGWNKTTIEKLEVGHMGLASADFLSGFTALKDLNVSDNSLTALDVSGFTALEKLDCQFNRDLASLSINAGLKDLEMGGTKLSKDNVDFNGADLTVIKVDDMYFDLATLQSFTHLETLDVDGYHWGTFDFSPWSSLTDVRCDNSNLTSLTLGTQNSLTCVRANDNRLTSLDLRGLNGAVFSELYIGGNSIPALTLPSGTALQDLGMDDNPLGQRIEGRTLTDNGDGTWSFDVNSLSNTEAVVDPAKVTVVIEGNITGYNNASGVVTFDAEVESFTYQYDIGDEDQYAYKMPVTVAFKNIDFEHAAERYHSFWYEEDGWYVWEDESNKIPVSVADAKRLLTPENWISLSLLDCPPEGERFYSENLNQVKGIEFAFSGEMTLQMPDDNILDSFSVNNPNAIIAIANPGGDNNGIRISVRSGKLTYTGNVFELYLAGDGTTANADSEVVINGNIQNLTWYGQSAEADQDGQGGTYWGNLTVIGGTIASGIEKGSISVYIDDFVGTVKVNLDVGAFSKGDTDPDLVIEDGVLKVEATSVGLSGALSKDDVMLIYKNDGVDCADQNWTLGIAPLEGGNVTDITLPDGFNETMIPSGDNVSVHISDSPQDGTAIVLSGDYSCVDVSAGVVQLDGTVQTVWVSNFWLSPYRAHPQIDITINGSVSDLSFDGINKGTNVETGDNGSVDHGYWWFYFNGGVHEEPKRFFGTIDSNTSIMSNGSFLLMSTEENAAYGAIAATGDALNQAAEINDENSFVAMDIRNAGVDLDESEQALVGATVPNGTVVTGFDVQVTAYTVNDDGALVDENTLSSLASKATFTLQLPTNDPDAEYTIVRLHDGDPTPTIVGEAGGEDGQIEVTSDLFSKFVVMKIGGHNYVAEVNSQGFESFAEAVAAANNGEHVITLLADVTEPYALSLDIHTLSVAHNGHSLDVEVPSWGTLQQTTEEGVTTYTLDYAIADPDEDWAGRIFRLQYYSDGWFIRSTEDESFMVEADDMETIINNGVRTGEIDLYAAPATDDPMWAMLGRHMGTGPDDVTMVDSFNFYCAGEVTLTIPAEAYYFGAFTINNPEAVITIQRYDNSGANTNVYAGTLNYIGSVGDLRLYGSDDSENVVVTVNGTISELDFYGENVLNAAPFMGNLYVDGVILNGYEKGAQTVDLSEYKLGVVTIDMAIKQVNNYTTNGMEHIVQDGALNEACCAESIDSITKDDLLFYFAGYAGSYQHPNTDTGNWTVVVEHIESGAQSNLIELGEDFSAVDVHLIPKEQIYVVSLNRNRNNDDTLSAPITLPGDFHDVQIHDVDLIVPEGSNYDWLVTHSTFVAADSQLPYTTVTVQGTVKDLSISGPADHITVKTEGEGKILKGSWETFDLGNFYKQKTRFFTPGTGILFANGLLNVMSYDTAEMDTLGAIMPSSATLTEATENVDVNQATFMDISSSSVEDLTDAEAAALEELGIDQDQLAAGFQVDVAKLTFNDDGSITGDEVTELRYPVPLTLELPSDQDDDTVYQIVRLHEGDELMAEVIGTSDLGDDSITVNSDLFSKFMVVQTELQPNAWFESDVDDTLTATISSSTLTGESIVVAIDPDLPDDDPTKIVFDSTASEAIAENAGTEDVILTVKKLEEDPQERTVIFEVTMTTESGVEVFSDNLAAGTAWITVPYAVETGYAPEVYLIVDGTLMPVELISYTSTSVTFKVEHFSNYMVKASDTPISYTIRFVNWDGTELQSSEVVYGETPVYNGEAPTKPNDDDRTYAFAGWTPEIAEVTGDATYTAVYTVTSGTIEVIFDANGGYIDGDPSVTQVSYYIQAGESLEELVNESYNMQHLTKPYPQWLPYGWYLDAECTQPIDETYIPTNDVTIYWGWVESTCIYLHANGGRIILNGSVLDYYRVFLTPDESFTDEHLVVTEREFLGWYYDPECTDRAVPPGEAITPSQEKEMHLYAAWAEVDGHMVTFDANEAYGGKLTYRTYDQMSFFIPEGTTVDFEVDVENSDESLVFAGWNLAPDGSGETIDPWGYVPTEDVIFYAKWVEGVEVTFDANGGCFFGIPDETSWSVMAPKGGTSIRYYCEEPEKDGYAFVGWSIHANGNGDLVDPWNYELTYTENITFYARWAKKCTVTFNSNGGTDVADITQTYGTAVTEPAVPTKTGYYFVGWYVEGEENSFDFATIITENLTLIAKWARSAKYSATLSLQDNININFYVKDIEEDDKPWYTIKWTFDGQEHEKDLKDVDREDDGRYRIILARVYSYQMTLPAHIYVYCNDVLVKEVESYSVQTYFLNMLNKSTTDATTKELCRAGLDYGANAQLFFDGKTYAGGIPYACDVENLANQTTNPGNSISATKPINISRREGDLSGTGISKLSASLILGTETTIKLYITYEGDISDLIISCDQRSITQPVRENDGRYSISIPGIRSYELHKDYVISVVKGVQTIKVTYSAYAYAAKNWDSADSKLKNLCRALVAYGDIAKSIWN